MKKNVTAKELSIRLMAFQDIKQDIRQSRRTISRTISPRVHDFKLILDNEKEYSVNQLLVYPFSIQIPEFSREQIMIPEQSGDTALGKFAEFIAKEVPKIPGERHHTCWYLWADLTVPGMFNDVKKKIQINVVD